MFNVLKNCNIISHWKKGKTDSKDLKNKGIKAFKTFQSMVEKKLVKTPLERTCETEKIPEDSYSFPLICDAIIRRINGENIELLIGDPPTDLYYRGTKITTGKIARGKTEYLECLKKKILGLFLNLEVEKHVKIYTDSMEKLNSYENFSEFHKRLDKLIENWKYDHEFRPQY